MLILNGHILLLVFEVGLSELAVRTEHIHNLVDVHLLHVLASGLQILARIEVIGMLSQILTDGSIMARRLSQNIVVVDGKITGLS